MIIDRLKVRFGAMSWLCCQRRQPQKLLTFTDRTEAYPHYNVQIRWQDNYN